MAQVLRNFKYSDADMLQDADTMLAVYTDNETYFTEFNAILFPLEFKTNFQGAIDAARAAMRDDVIIDEMAEMTARVEEVMQNCRKQFKLIKFLVERAFPDKKTVHNQFGFNDYSSIGRSHNKMKVFLDSINSPLRKYLRDLTAIGAPADLADTTAMLAEQLNQAKTDQQEFIKYRPELTDTRILLLNAVWQFIVDIYSASQIIFDDNETKLALFALRNVTSSVEAETEEEEPETV